MPFDYTLKGWPSPITLNGAVYTVASCDKDDTGLVYVQAGVKNPHVTIHGVNKEGPDDWHRGGSGSFHVRVSNTKLYEFDTDGKPYDFGPPKASKGKKGVGTGTGSPVQTVTANAIARDFVGAIRTAITG